MTVRIVSFPRPHLACKASYETRAMTRAYRIAAGY